MELFAWFVFGFTVLQFFIALINLVFKERTPNNIVDQQWPLVSILIPARNEEHNIGTIIEDILKQSYSDFELIICDDMSEDKTAGIVNYYAKTDNRIKLINTDHLPEGWLGKTYACHLLAKQATGQYYIFVDADVSIKNNFITKAISYVLQNKLHLFTVFPKQIMIDRAEKYTVPVMNYILLTLLPLILVRKSKFHSLSAANGQFMLFNALTYKNMHPHEQFKDNKVEDINISRLFKTNNLNISCQLGDEDISCRMYKNYKEAIAGFSKNVIAFFGNSYIAAILFWFITTLGIVFIFWQLDYLYAYIYLCLYILTRIFVSINSRQNVINNILYIIHQQFSFGLFIISAIHNSIKKQSVWKGRNIS